MARLVFISDTHLRHSFSVPDGDVLVHCGDLTMRGTERETKVALDWVATMPHSRKVLIAGNHDFFFDPDAPRRFHDWSLRRHYSIAELLAQYPTVHYLFDSALSINGLSFYGSPWQPWFYDWAFNKQRGDAIAEKWALIPEETDILITHGPPRGILDRTPSGEHAGCDDLLAAVKRVHPLVHAFGHIHGGAGSEQNEGTLFVNACICDEDYRATQPPVVVDVTAGKAVVVDMPTASYDRSKERLRKARSDVERYSAP